MPTIFFVFCQLLFSFSVLALQNLYCQLPCDFFVESVPHTVCERQEEKCGPDEKCGTNFKVIILNDNDRQYILDIHNYLRNKVALGFEKRGNQPKASNMNIMRYNKELEFIAQCWVNTCNGSPLKHDRCRRTAYFDHVGQNLGYTFRSDQKIDKIKSIKNLILLWYDEVKLFNSSWIHDTKDRGPQYDVGHYTQLVWADSTDIGCAISYYTETISNQTWHNIVLACNYGPGGNYLGYPLYEVGKPASKCPEGLTRNSLYKGLCGKSEIVREAANFTFNVFEMV